MNTATVPPFRLKEIESDELHKGWVFNSPIGLRYAIKHALGKEFNYLSPSDIELTPLTLLSSTPNTFAFKAQVGTRMIVGKALVECSVPQCRPGEEVVITFVRVSYGRGIKL